MSGDAPFERIASEVGRLVTEKNAAYGDSFAKCGDFLRLLYPAGVRPDQYGDALATVRIFDKLMRIATRKDYGGESPYRDIAGYGLLGAANDVRVAQERAAIQKLIDQTHEFVEAADRSIRGADGVSGD